MARIACLIVDNLPLQALLRADPELYGVALAITEPLSHARQGQLELRVRSTRSSPEAPPLTSRVLYVSPEALALGVRPGQTAAQARATAPSVVVRPAHPEQIRSARAALLDTALGFAPRVEPRGDAIFLEVGDLGRLFAGERELALSLRARAERVGLAVGVGIASNKGVACAAAGSSLVPDERAGEDGIRLVPAGAEARFMAGLPVNALLHEVSGAGHGGKEAVEALAQLQRWGVHSAGRLAELPAKEVALRLGEVGARLHRLACGRGGDLLAPSAPPDEFEEGMEIDYAIVDLEALGFVLRGLIDRLLVRLVSRRLACGGLSLRLRLEDRGHDVRHVPVAAPTVEVASLLTLCRLDLERRPPTSGVVSLVLSARAACARPDQLDLFRPAGPAPERLATTMARLQALLGDDAVGSPRDVDTHREEAIEMGPYAPPARGATRRASQPAKPAPAPKQPKSEADAKDPGGSALAFRRFRPEPELEVILDGGRTPRAMNGEGVSCRVLVAAGPFRAVGEWWSEHAYARDYWDVHASDGALYRIYRDARDRWLLAGYYD